MSTYQLISYPVSQDQPTWPGNPSFYLEPHSSIGKGDSCNTALIHLFNHYGTHIDGPRHFYAKGKTLDSLPLEQFIYERPLLLDIPKQKGEKVMPSDLEPYAAELEQADLLLIRTGFWKTRITDPETYEKTGPAVSSECAIYLQEHVQNLKAIALDFVSLASYSDQNDGTLAHQYMLGMFHSHFFCIIEDVNMKDLPQGFLKGVSAIPMFIEGIDSSPVTMWAVL